MQLRNTLAPGSVFLSALHPLATPFLKLARGESGGLEQMLDIDAGLASTGDVPRATEICSEECGRLGIVASLQRLGVTGRIVHDAPVDPGQSREACWV